MSAPYEKPINWSTSSGKLLRYNEIAISKDSAKVIFETLKKVFASDELDAYTVKEYEDLVKAFTELGKKLGRYDEIDV
ncbi:MAG: hypothetical protein JRM72_01375 [Nitrososphaerota archaeon]|nr:hypothetical protein [Nitrososphaerota archaeon]